MDYGTALALHKSVYGCGADFILVKPPRLAEILSVAIEAGDEEACSALDELWPSVHGLATHLPFAAKLRAAWEAMGGGPPRTTGARPNRVGEAYGTRNKNLKRLGYATYKEYLRSFLWSSIRKRVLYERPLCDFCGTKSTQVHHSSYSLENLRGNTTVGLHSTCADCHDAGEFESGKKITPREATAKMRSLAYSA